MRIKRIEIEGEAGHVAIERLTGTATGTLRIDSFVRDPKGERAWVSWEIESHIAEEELFEMARDIQRRTEGRGGTNSMIHDYLRELQRFTD